MSISIDMRTARRIRALVTLAAALLASVSLASCLNNLGPKPPQAETCLSIAVTRLSPLFAAAFSSAGGSGKDVPSSKALIGANRLEFRLIRKGETSPLLEWSIVTSNTLPQPGDPVMTKVVVPEDAEFCVVDVKVYNSAVSDTAPVMVGSAEVAILPLSSTTLNLSCVPASPILTGNLPYSASASPKPFVLAGSGVEGMGQESWYKIVPATSSLALSVAASSGNTNAIACGLYNASGNSYFDGASHILSATQGSPVDKWIRVTAGATYYLGIAQKEGTSGVNNDVQVGIAEGPEKPAAPILAAPADKPGQIDVGWTPDTRMTGYDLYYKAGVYDTPVLVNATPLATSVTTYPLTGMKPGHTYSVYLVSHRSDSFDWKSESGAAASATPVHSRQSVDDGTRTWTSEAIGDIGEGSASYSPAGSIYSLSGGGFFGGLSNGEVWLQYLHVPQSGDFTLVAHLVSALAGATNEYGKAGIAVFDGISPSASRTGLGIQFVDTGTGSQIVNGMELMNSAGGSISFGLATVQTWIKAQRTGNALQFWTSEDGSTWTARQLFDSATETRYDATLSTSTPEIGLFVSAGSFNNLASVTFDNVTLTTP